MTGVVAASPRIRLATASPSTQSSRHETLAQLERIAKAAGENRADFLLLPEAYLGGYPRGSDFGCKIGGRTEEGRNDFQKYFKDAIDLGDIVGPGGAGGMAKWVKRDLGEGVDAADEENTDINRNGPAKRGDGTREELERIARETGVFLVVGLVERAGGSLYCAVVYVCPRRGVIGKRRKVLPTGSERLIWAQGSPATLKAVSTTIRGIRINLAAAICWENYMPLLRQSLYAQNINLYFAPTADGRDTWLPLMQTIGIEGRCFVVSSNMCVRQNDNNNCNYYTTATNHKPAATAAAATAATDPDPKQRRNSCLTDEGFEIALPNPNPNPSRKSRSRRRSVFDEDGNEIVLSPPAVFEEEEEDKQQQQQKQELPPVETSFQRKKREKQDNEKFLVRGGSSIVSPFGEVLAGPQWEDDRGIIYADVDMGDCVRGRLDLDAAGSYSRNDSFKFSVEGLDLEPLPYYH
ncbi:carbon-nitrogen hydrolase [Poronia punctata]|nr:carbon-nitrogen hydrolase [Poronia punctata]